jgi:phosphoserine phosphatase
MSYLTIVSAQPLDQPASQLLAVLAEHFAFDRDAVVADGGILHVAGITTSLNRLERNQLLVRLLEPFAVDWAWQDSPPQPKALAGFDMDGTVVAEESMVLLALAVEEVADAPQHRDLVQQITHMTELTMASGGGFEQGFRQRLALFSGTPHDLFLRAASRFTLNPGMAEVLTAMQRAGTQTALITGGFDPMKSLIAGRCGFDQAFGNQLLFDDQQRFTGDYAQPIVDMKAKADILKKLATKQGINGGQVLFIGDGSNDAAALTWVLEGGGLAVGYRPKPVLLGVINAVVQHSGLSLLAFQNYKT